MTQPNQIEVALRRRVALIAWPAAALQTVFHIVDHAHPREHAVLLEHHAAVRPGTGDRPSVNFDAAAALVQQPADDLQQRGLAAARRTQQADELPAPDAERNSVEG